MRADRLHPPVRCQRHFPANQPLFGYYNGFLASLACRAAPSLPESVCLSCSYSLLHHLFFSFLISPAAAKTCMYWQGAIVLLQLPLLRFFSLLSPSALYIAAAKSLTPWLGQRTRSTSSSLFYIRLLLLLLLEWIHSPPLPSSSLARKSSCVRSPPTAARCRNPATWPAPAGGERAGARAGGQPRRA